MDFNNMIEQVIISPNVLQVKEDYMYLYRSLELEGLPQDTGDGFNMAFVLLDRAYHLLSLSTVEEIAMASAEEDPELGVG